MSKKKKFTDKLTKENRPFDEETVALEISEDKRLNRLGIDPDGDPVDIMEALYQKHEALEKKKKDDK